MSNVQVNNKSVGTLLFNDYIAKKAVAIPAGVSEVSPEDFAVVEKFLVDGRYPNLEVLGKVEATVQINEPAPKKVEESQPIQINEPAPSEIKEDEGKEQINEEEPVAEDKPKRGRRKAAEVEVKSEVEADTQPSGEDEPAAEEAQGESE